MGIFARYHLVDEGESLTNRVKPPRGGAGRDTGGQWVGGGAGWRGLIGALAFRFRRLGSLLTLRRQ